eukprot:1149976-Pelagomonas_calceolata.AAC.1
MNGVHTDRCHIGLSFYVQALSKLCLKAGMAPPLLVWMPAGMRDSSSTAWQGIQVPENISRAIPDY